MTSKRMRLPPASKEMKAWSAALGGEVSTWPQCRARAFFGLNAFYRGKRIFALLPRTRSLDPPRAIAVKLESAGPRLVSEAKRDPRMSFRELEKKRWFVFTLSTDSDLRDALGWLSRAWRAAG